MALDETLFGVVFNALRRLRAAPTRRAREAGCDVAPVVPHLQRLASLIAGRPLEVHAGAGSPGYIGDALLLPTRFDALHTVEANERALVAALLYAVAARALGMADVWGGGGERLAAATAVPWMRSWLAELFPGAVAICVEADAAAAVDARGPLAPLVGAVTRGDAGGFNTAAEATGVAWRAHVETLRRARPLPAGAWVPEHWPLPRPATAVVEAHATHDAPDEADARPSTVRKGRLREHVTAVDAFPSREDENPLVHSFEKVHTADDYAGGRKRIDGADELGAHGDAVDELTLGRVIRTRQTAQSLYDADRLFAGTAVEIDAPVDPAMCVMYDEWDTQRRAYRRNWCAVSTTRVEAAASADIRQHQRRIALEQRAEIRAIEAEFARLKAATRLVGRQRDGVDLDIDRVVARQVDVQSRRTPDDRVFVSRRRSTRDVQLLVLLDGSLSTDAWVGGRRVLDVERDAVGVLAAACPELGDRVALAAFYSQTRRDCRVVELKRFDESWQTGMARTLALRPTGYTRMGPAVRHATAAMAQQPARRRIVVVVSDGKPTDYDRYEGRYGVDDVRQAVREADVARVRVFGIGIDPSTSGAMARMFGADRAALVPSLSRLPAALGVALHDGLA